MKRTATALASLAFAAMAWQAASAAPLAGARQPRSFHDFRGEGSLDGLNVANQEVRVPRDWNATNAIGNSASAGLNVATRISDDIGSLPGSRIMTFSPNGTASAFGTTSGGILSSVPLKFGLAGDFGVAGGVQGSILHNGTSATDFLAAATVVHSLEFISGITIPEPSTLALSSVGLVFLALSVRRTSRVARA